MSKKDDKITEQGYTIEALEDEIRSLEEEIERKGERIWELIQENDRLTLTYEPYQPEGDAYHGVEYFDLIEENDRLRITVERLQHDLALSKVTKEKVSNPKAGCVSLDFWPPRDWIRLSYHSWSPGQAAQMCVGPIRIDWFAS